MLLGDINGDGKITFDDLKKLSMYLSAGVELDDRGLKAADIDKDGVITEKDYILLENHLKGLKMISEVIE